MLQTETTRVKKHDARMARIMRFQSIKSDVECKHKCHIITSSAMNIDGGYHGITSKFPEKTSSVGQTTVGV